MSNKTRATRTEREVKRVLKRGKISVPELQEIVEKVQDNVDVLEEKESQGRVPGYVRDGKKTPFTHKDLLDRYGLVSFIPEETTLITFQGVQYQLYSGYETKVPKCIELAYRNHMRELRDASRSEDLKKNGIVVELGVGAL